jgi:hypothetical protein
MMVFNTFNFLFSQNDSFTYFKDNLMMKLTLRGKVVHSKTPKKTRAVSTPWPCHLHYGNSNISPCKNIIFKKNPLKKPKASKIS